MAITKHVKHIRSSVADSIPTTEQLDYGEIAINYSAENERLFIKNANNEIVPFYSGKVIEENEQVTAAALTDLDSRINDIEENNVNTENMESITYSELKSKRDGGELVPGKHYRITDYVTTTSQENTQSAGHQFDVVVLALDEKTLSENAHAMLHEGDTYFSTNGADLSAWELKYCLDNDTNRFAWADSVNGKGVIYYIKDEWNNECPYDFKNIQFKRWAITKTNASSDDPFNNRYVGINNDGEILPNGYDIPDDNDFKWLYTFSGQSASWDEENDSIIYPDDITRDTEIYDLSNVDMHGFYNENTDPVGCSNNIIKEYYGGRNFAVNTLTLNNIIFTGWFIDVETLPSNYEELYGDGIFKMMSVPFSNTFENECYNNTFGNGCGSNTFGNSVNRNTFGNNAYGNTFGNGCGSNTFGNNAYGNTFGNNCGSNTFGNDFQYNTFGNECYDNSFGNGCWYNTFGNSCFLNTFGNNAYSNTFGNKCNRNSFGNNAYGNTFGNDIQFIRFVKEVTNNVTTTEVGADYINWCVVENGNKRIKVTFSSTTSSSTVAGNITITQGVNNATDDGTDNSNWVNITNSNTITLNNSTKTTIRTIYRPSTTEDISI